MRMRKSEKLKAKVGMTGMEEERGGKVFTCISRFIYNHSHQAEAGNILFVGLAGWLAGWLAFKLLCHHKFFVF